MVSLYYRRPSHVSRPSSCDSVSGEEKQKSIDESISSGKSSMSKNIPDELAFDKIVSGGVCPPLSLRDFMNYLKYIELDAENLQFFLWFRDYSKRFEQLSDSDKALSPEWAGQEQEAETRRTKTNAEAAAIFKGTDFDNAAKSSATDIDKNPFYTPDEHKGDGWSFASDGASLTTSGEKIDHSERATGAFEDAGLQWKPLSVQPYREEIARIISIYIADDGTRQLNLSSKERNRLLHALQHTTHPSAFKEVITTIEWSLRCQAHPNFIRWAICNGNRPRVVFARGLGVVTIALALIASIILALSSVPRPWRVLPLILYIIGISTLYAAIKGMCVVLHGMHHRHVRPWELFAGDDEKDQYGQQLESYSSLEFHNTSNSYEDEPWVAKYDKRNIIRKVFDREVWIEEPMLRQIQDMIFVQALLGGLIIGGLIVVIFCALPPGNFF